MSVSVQAAPRHGRDRPSNFSEREPISAKFTAVNRSPPSPPPTRPFGFRPEQPSSPEQCKKSLPSVANLAANEDFQRNEDSQSPIQPKVSPTDSHKDYGHPVTDMDQLALGKRKRSVEHSGRKDLFVSVEESSSPTKKFDAFEGANGTHRSKATLDSPRVEPNSKQTRFAWPDATQLSPSRQTRSPEDEVRDALSGMSTSPEDPNHTKSTKKGSTQPSIETNDDIRPPRKRQFANRTKSGCHTCRDRKKKCDEGKPICQNCIRGNFTCKGYGEKKSSTGTSGQRTHPPLQSKDKERQLPDNRYPKAPPPPPASGWSDYPPHSHRNFDGSRYEGSRSERRDSYVGSTWPSETSMVSSSSRHSGSIFPPVPAMFREHEREPEHDRLASAARYGQNIAPASGHSRLIAINASSGMGGQDSIYLPNITSHFGHSNMSEKDKMMQGKPFRHLDNVLQEDRKQTRAAVERYNNAARPSYGASDSEIGRLFLEIIKAPGSIGDRPYIEPPFQCDYGYNLHIGTNVQIGENCRIQAPCKVNIGSRTVVGPDVKILGLEAPLDPKIRNGNSGCVIGGPIVIEEDCYIGGNVTILANVVIKRNAYVSAGTVVDKSQDVQPDTVVAGNPMRVIRGIGPSDEGNIHRPSSHIESEEMPERLYRERTGFHLPGGR